ncbi:PIM1 kinase, partial [Sitta europaea]|nr:PIM1 kinase [Sitta europaea]
PAGKAQEALQQRYRPVSLMGRSGFASVLAGMPLLDSAPVTSGAGGGPTEGGIVLLPQPSGARAPLEIVLLDKVSCGCAAVIQLLEWLELPSSFLLVLERP